VPQLYNFVNRMAYFILAALVLEHHHFHSF